MRVYLVFILFVIHLAANTVTAANKCSGVFETDGRQRISSAYLEDIGAQKPPPYLGHHILPDHRVHWQKLLVNDSSPETLLRWIGGGQFPGIWTNPLSSLQLPAIEGKEYLHFRPREGSVLIQFVLAKVDVEHPSAAKAFQRAQSDSISEINREVLDQAYKEWLKTKPDDYKASDTYDTIINASGKSLSQTLSKYGLPTDFNFYKENRILGVIAPMFTHTIILNPYEISGVDFPSGFINITGH